MPGSHINPDEIPAVAGGRTGLEMLVERFGGGALEARLAREGELLRSRGRGQGRGLFRFEHRVDFYSWIDRVLFCVGLRGRALRNYLDIRVARNSVRLASLPPAFDGFTLLQVSDLHADLHPDFPAAVGRVIAPLEYDLAVATGDFRVCTFSDHAPAEEASGRILAGLKTEAYAVLGNHDSIRKVPGLERRGLRFLLNENVAIVRGGERIFLAGIDDPNFYRSHDLEKAARDIPADACAILLSHSPQTFREAEALGFSLLLAGHTHGGQICLPGGWVVMHDGTSPRHLLAGPWRHRGLQGYTSRGTGATGLPARLNCPAEVTLHTLRRA